jgi:hypothetical protein
VVDLGRDKPAAAGYRTSVPPRRRRRRQSTRSWVILLLLLVVLIGVGWYTGGLDWLGERLDGGRAESGEAAGDVDADRARSLLAELTVADWDSMRGYSRDRFPHWDEQDGCDTRDTVLRRDGEDLNVDEDSCEVRDGTWRSPFDGETLTDPDDVEIDHLVPLANAWRSGASEWDDERRAEFANDLERPELHAVSVDSNRAKGDQDPSDWKPPERSYWCRYAHDWVLVKHHWELSVTAAEKDELEDMLRTCD